MSIMMVTNISSYTKTMAMAMKWQKRQEENNYTPGSTSTSATDSFRKQVDELRYPKYDRSAQRESDIELKMTAGKKLDSQEMQYLKTHNRSVYQIAKKIDRERTVYEKALASCTTKEEVEQLKADYAAIAVKRINAIRNNASISVQKKRELLQFEHFRGAALDDAMHTFIKSRDYKRLPERKVLQADSDETEGIPGEFGEFHDLKTESLVTIPALEILLENKARQAEAAEKAANYEVEKKETDTDTKEKIPVQEESTDDAEEEGSIMKAILDEEARWAREEEDPLNSQNQELSQAGKSPDELPVGQAKAAYLASQAYAAPGEASKIDIRK